jgi:hypothetical protein
LFSGDLFVLIRCCKLVCFIKPLTQMLHSYFCTTVNVLTLSACVLKISIWVHLDFSDLVFPLWCCECSFRESVCFGCCGP